MTLRAIPAANPPPASRLERKRELRAEAILDRAAAIVATEGIERLTLQHVAGALGYVPAALYRYFGSKDALLAALQRRAIGEVHRGFAASQAALSARAHRASPPTAALAALLEAARFYLALPAALPDAWRLIAILLGDPRPLLSDDESRRTAPLLLAFLGDVRLLFERAADAGALGRADPIEPKRDPRSRSLERTLVFWSALQGALALEKARRIALELPDASRVGMAATTALLAGWGAQPEAVRRAERYLDSTTDEAPAGAAKEGKR